MLIVTYKVYTEFIKQSFEKGSFFIEINKI